MRLVCEVVCMVGSFPTWLLISQMVPILITVEHTVSLLCNLTVHELKMYPVDMCVIIYGFSVFVDKLQLLSVFELPEMMIVVLVFSLCIYISTC